ncbi:MAG: hypothetical protein LBM22_02050 [Endomicrobium sp.]|jgi:hypothetical protein|nr:hypothetical protein [Endomicrobium sp.]
MKLCNKYTLDFNISRSSIGKYEMIQLALDWVDILKKSDSYKNLTQVEIINKVLYDVLFGIVTKDNLKELNIKMKKKDTKSK